MKQRTDYQRGATEYLQSFKVNETRVYDKGYLWRSLSSIACRLRLVYGWRFKFRTKQGVKTIRRWK